jgi:hypothetical protein
MPEPRPPAENDIRLRKILDDDLLPPRWPAGFVVRGFLSSDAPALHALLTEVFDDGADGPYEEWWPRVSGDAEFDPALCFLVIDGKGCWRVRHSAGRRLSSRTSPSIPRRAAGASARR